MINYHAGMDWDAQALADLSGIAAGWSNLFDESDSISGPYMVGCEICGFVESQALSLSATESSRGRDLERRCQDNVWRVFRIVAKERHCPHLEKYDFWKSNPGTLPGVQMAALLRAAAYATKKDNGSGQ